MAVGSCVLHIRFDLRVFFCQVRFACFFLFGLESSVLRAVLSGRTVRWECAFLHFLVI